MDNIEPGKTIATDKWKGYHFIDKEHHQRQVPRDFVWRGRTVTVRAVLRTWGETGKCRHGSREMYVRKHW